MVGSTDASFLCSPVVWGPFPTGTVSRLWLMPAAGTISPTIAKTSGRSIECSDRPFLLQENASYFQRNGALIFWTPFSIGILMATENTQIAPAYSSAI